MRLTVSVKIKIVINKALINEKHNNIFTAETN